MIDIINTNRALIEPYRDEALHQYIQTETSDSEATVQIENEEMQNVCLNEAFDQSKQNNITISISLLYQYHSHFLWKVKMKLMSTCNLLLFSRDKFLTLFIRGPKKLKAKELKKAKPCETFPFIFIWLWWSW